MLYLKQNPLCVPSAIANLIGMVIESWSSVFHALVYFMLHVTLWSNQAH